MCEFDFLSLKIQYVLEQNLLDHSFIAPGVTEVFSNDYVWLTPGTLLSFAATNLSERWQEAKTLEKACGDHLFHTLTEEIKHKYIK